MRRRWLRMGTTVELLQAMGHNGRWWLVPMAVVLLGTGGLLMVVTAIEYVAPFVYTLF